METTDSADNSTPRPTLAVRRSTQTHTFQLIALTVPGGKSTFFGDAAFRPQPIATDNGSRWLRYVSPVRRDRRTTTLVVVIDSVSRFVYGAFPLVSGAGGEP
jgi:hypothetical protein